MGGRLRPLHDRIIVKPREAGEHVWGGIIIPDTAREKPQEGDVIAVGPGRLLEDGRRSPMDVKVGDRVIFEKYAGTEVELDEESYLILRESDILGIIPSKKK